jgi:hypothetical protein
MIISIDYDDTFTADPESWANVIELLSGAGHTVICVTARPDAEPHVSELYAALPSGMSIVFAGDEAKQPSALKAGFAVDIWIDDNPIRVMEPYVRTERIIKYSNVPRKTMLGGRR